MILYPYAAGTVFQRRSTDVSPTICACSRIVASSFGSMQAAPDSREPLTEMTQNSLRCAPGQSQPISWLVPRSPEATVANGSLKTLSRPIIFTLAADGTASQVTLTVVLSSMRTSLITGAGGTATPITASGAPDG